MISMRLNETIEAELKQIARFEGISVSDYVRNLIINDLEDKYDLKIAEDAHEDFIKSGEKTYSFEEVFKWNIGSCFLKEQKKRYLN